MSDNEMNGHKPSDDLEGMQKLEHEIFVAEQTMPPDKFIVWVREEPERAVCFLGMMDEIARAGSGPPPVPGGEEKGRAETMADVFGPRLERFRFTIPGLIK